MMEAVCYSIVETEALSAKELSAAVESWWRTIAAGYLEDRIKEVPY